jgi:hypothetical protein
MRDWMEKNVRFWNSLMLLHSAHVVMLCAWGGKGKEGRRG